MQPEFTIINGTVKKQKRTKTNKYKIKTIVGFSNNIL